MYPSQNTQLQQLLAKRIISVPTNAAVSKPFVDFCLNNRLSFESLMAVSSATLDYRLMLSDCWTTMQASMSIETGRDINERIRYTLMVLALKFPQYFVQSDFLILLRLFPAQISIDNQWERDLQRIHAYLHNYGSLLCIHTSIDTDILGYYFPEASAIRKSGVFQKFLKTTELYLQVLAEPEPKDGVVAS
jgi:hypothetical protein